MAKRIKVGNLYGIHLPNGKVAFGRCMRESSIAIYNHIGYDINDLPKDEMFQFIVGIYQTDINKDLTYIDYLPFDSEEKEWPPDSYIYDVIDGGYSIYHRGEISPSSKEKCIGLEFTGAWHTYHIVDRIMGDDKWGGVLK